MSKNNELTKLGRFLFLWKIKLEMKLSVDDTMYFDVCGDIEMYF